MSTLVRSLAVLIVEDHHDGADALARCLRYWGYAVRIAYDGNRAIQAVENYPFDAVLCDIGLPGMNGYTVASEVRRIRGRGPLLVAVTAYDSPMVREHARAAGFDYFFTKPAEPAELDRLMQEHAERREAEEKARAD